MIDSHCQNYPFQKDMFVSLSLTWDSEVYTTAYRMIRSKHSITLPLSELRIEFYLHFLHVIQIRSAMCNGDLKFDIMQGNKSPSAFCYKSHF